MPATKTRPTQIAVADFLAAVTPDARRHDALALDTLFRELTGWIPVMWGPSMVGYGAYSYTYASGHSGRAMATGFSPRKPAHVIYAMPGPGAESLLSRLGPHEMGKSCLYIKRLSDIDTDVLAQIIRAGLSALAAEWPIEPS